MRDTVPRPDLTSVFVDRSLKTDQITAAKDRANAIRMKIARGEEHHRHRDHYFEEAFDAVLLMAKTKAKNTHGQTKSIIDGHLRPWFRENMPYLNRRFGDLEPFEKSFEEVWAKYKIAQGKERKLEHDRRYLVMALKRAANRGWIKKQFEKRDFELNEVTKPIGKYVDDQKVQALLDATFSAPATDDRIETYEEPKLRLRILMAVLMGMRKSEIQKLQKSEIDIGRREINLDAGRVKTRKRREVPIPIPEELFSHLKRFCDEAPGPFIFPAMLNPRHGTPRIIPGKPMADDRRSWNRVRKAAKVNCRFHDLRHTALTNMMKAGFPDTAIRKTCGVSEETMRRIYAHIEKELKDRFRGLFRGKFVY